MSDGEITARHYATRELMRVRWERGRITSLEAGASSSDAGLWIAPGLVDLQVNGFAGIDFQQDELRLADLLAAVRGLREAGCARFLLALITDEWPRLMARLRRLRSLRAESPELKYSIAGWHIEGPFLSPEAGFHGAHNPTLMLNPTPAHIRELRNATGDDPVMLTLAPERPGAIEAIALAVQLGIKVSLGHTNAGVESLAEAVRAGARGFTHLGNGCPRELDRHDNILWRAMETPGLTASLIPDAIHMSPPLFRAMHKWLDRESIYYTTDAMAAAGAPPGRHRLGRLEVEVGQDQIVRQPESTNFAGSALRPIDGIFRAAQMLGRSWQEVWDGFSRIPARLMGLPFGLELGAPAEFCLLKMNAGNEIQELRVIHPLSE